MDREIKFKLGDRVVFNKYYGKTRGCTHYKLNYPSDFINKLQFIDFHKPYPLEIWNYTEIVDHAEEYYEFNIKKLDLIEFPYDTLQSGIIIGKRSLCICNDYIFNIDEDDNPFVNHMKSHYKPIYLVAINLKSIYKVPCDNVRLIND